MWFREKEKVEQPIRSDGKFRAGDKVVHRLKPDMPMIVLGSYSGQNRERYGNYLECRGITPEGFGLFLFLPEELELAYDGGTAR